MRPTRAWQLVEEVGKVVGLVVVVAGAATEQRLRARSGVQCTNASKERFVRGAPENGSRAASKPSQSAFPKRDAREARFRVKEAANVASAAAVAAGVEDAAAAPALSVIARVERWR